MKVIVPVCTRPAIIKIAPIIKELTKRNIDFKIVHTGQHYSKFLSDIFFEELEISPPSHNLNVGSGTHAEQTGKAMIGLEKYFLKEKPSVVLVHGDTNMVPSACLASVKLHIKTIHKEAGLRSYDRTMPEEINRIIADHISDYLCAPTETSKNNLIKEGVNENKISVTGNTIVDALYFVLPKVIKIENSILNNLNSSEYFVLTLHRAGHVDKKNILIEILKGLQKVYEKFEIPIVYPIHPRAKKKIEEFGLWDLVKNVKIIEPLGYLEFLKLMIDSKLVLTDSGGIQEETCTLKIPCVTIGKTTERVESLEVGSNCLTGPDSNGILEGVEKMINKSNDWENPYGDGKAAEKIVKSIKNWFENE